MSTAQTQAAGSVFDALLASLQKAADYHRDDTVPPAAILWPDEKREWERLVPRLRMVLPHFLVFGPYDQANRTGPAIWLRCVLAGKVPDVTCPSGIRAHHLSAGRQPGDASGHRGMPQRTEAAGRASVPGRVLVAGQRQGLDRRRLPPDQSRRAATEDRQGQRHGGLDSPGPGKAGRCAGGGTSSQGGQPAN